jgi:hypothetical protein
MRLLEADFLSVDLRSITSNKNNTEPKSSYADTSVKHDKTAGEPLEIKPDTFNWKTEYEKRLADNKALSPEERVKDIDIEIKFFKEFFYSFTKGNQELADRLTSLGEPLRKALKVLGFKKDTNVFLSFFNQKYVQDNLLKTKLINVNTFKVLFNAVAKKLVAGSEFFKTNNYNLIYCRDFYTKPITEMEKFIQIQSHILTNSTSKYTQADQLKNRSTFLFIPLEEKEITKRVETIVKIINKPNLISLVPEMHIAKSKLNPLALAYKISGKDVLDTAAGKSHMTTKNQAAIANKLKSASQIYAALQFLSMNAGSRKAAQALTNDAFKNLSLDKISQATALLTTQKIMPSGEISKTEADNLAGILLGRLQELR